MRRPEPRKAALDPFHLATLALLVLVAVWLVLPLAWLFAQAPRGYSEGWTTARSAATSRTCWRTP